MTRAEDSLSTLFFAALALSLALFPIAALLIFLGPAYVDVPAEARHEFPLLAASVYFNFCTTLVGAAFVSVPWAASRFDLVRLADVTGLLVRVLLVVFCFQYWRPNLNFVSAGLFAGGLSNLAVNVGSARLLAPALRPRLSRCSWGEALTLWRTGRWLTVNQAAQSVWIGGELLFANMWLGAQAAGRYAPLTQWSSNLRTVAARMAATIGPSYVYFIARADLGALRRAVLPVSRILSLGVAFPVGFLIGCGKPLLSLWLGPEFAAQSLVFALVLLPVCLEAVTVTSFPVLVAANEVRPLALTCVASLAFAVVAAYLLAVPAGLGALGIAGGWLCGILLRHMGFLPRLMSPYLLVSPGFAIPHFARAIASVACVACASFILSQAISVNSWPRLLWLAIGLACPYYTAGFMFGLTSEEKNALRARLRAHWSGTG
jgi:membrane protein EpsK